MSGFVVHGVPGSPYVRAALLVLEEKRVPYHFAAMAFGTTKTTEHLARHAFGRIPAFEHDGWPLYETQAILRYVDAVVPAPALQPSEPQAAARMNQLMGITDWYFMPQVSRPVTFNRVVAPRFNLPANDEAVAGAIPGARICIAEIARLLGDHPWLAGGSLSLADLMLAPQMSMFALAPEGSEMLRQHDNLRGWIARMEARPSMVATTWDKLLEKIAAAA
jgi:glutathione S-transferase